MVRQQANRDRRERVTLLNDLPHLAQNRPGLFGGKDGDSVIGYHREIIGVCSVGSAVIRHIVIIGWFQYRCVQKLYRPGT